MLPRICRKNTGVYCGIYKTTWWSRFFLYLLFEQIKLGVKQVIGIRKWKSGICKVWKGWFKLRRNCSYDVAWRICIAFCCFERYSIRIEGLLENTCIKLEKSACFLCLIWKACPCCIFNADKRCRSVFEYKNSKSVFESVFFYIVERQGVERDIKK